MLINRTTGQALASQVRYCDTFWSKMRGLMFRRALDPDQAYIFCYRRESIVDSCIHMLFVFQAIAVVWLDAGQRVVDTVRALPFRPYYAPRAPAQYIIEAPPSLLERVGQGDELVFEESQR